MGCRSRRAREWSIRCQLEASTHAECCWTTLTYDAEHVPPTLRKSDLSGFLKRLRARMAQHAIRFFGSGEYGELGGRPHYHVILFGLPVSSSTEIDKAWKFGFTQTLPLGPRAIAYVAGYTSKKLGLAEKCGEFVDPETGEVFEHQPPFVLMSRRPGIGGAARSYWRSWRSSAVVDGREVGVPRFLHAEWLKRANALEVESLRKERRVVANKREFQQLIKPFVLAAAEADASARREVSSSRRRKL